MPPLDTLQTADPAPALRGGPARTPPAPAATTALAEAFAGQLAQALGETPAVPPPEQSGSTAAQPATPPADAAPGGPLPPPLLPPGAIPPLPAPSAARSGVAVSARASVDAPTPADEETAAETPTGSQPALAVQPATLPNPALTGPIVASVDRPPPEHGQDSAPIGPTPLGSGQGRARPTLATEPSEIGGAPEVQATTPPGETAANRVLSEPAQPQGQLPAVAAGLPPPPATAPQHLAPSAARAPAEAPPAPSLAAQIVPVLVTPVLIAIAAPAQPGAPQLLTIRLDPAELGRVQVRIERTEGGPVKVELAVERADTLMLLQRDQPQLQAALDLAGIPPEGRTVHLSLAPDRSPGNAGPSLAADAGPGGGGQRPGQGYGHPGESGRNTPEPHVAGPSRSTWGRAGLDITA